MFDIDHDENGVGSIFLHKFIDFNIMRLELSACGVPADNFFSGTDL